ncbi:MAG TPA: DUF4139 domain-containing protein [Vicinamibacterales bacterium]|nr:DUF4139 domain-containing protein [Vicinamibacterales bacterium]
MRHRVILAALAVCAGLSTLSAQQPTSPLPVRRVVLYKNGVGYFEHVGRVRGSQTLAIDFNTSQLNDVLTTLTAVDLGNGRIGNVSFNSEAPFEQRLSRLSLPVGQRTTLPEMLDGLRGARLEVSDGGRTLVGRLLSIEQKPPRKDEPPHTELSIVTDGGVIRTIALRSSAAVKLLDRDLATQVRSYLDLLESSHSGDRRRLSIATVGTGERNVLVSYISEVPVWKTTYRIVLPSGGDRTPQLQGWAIVDNTVGQDWTDVELSLVAGAPQSFVQRLSEPQYVHRPVVDIERPANPRPQTHESAMNTVGDTNVARVTGGIVGGLVSAPAASPTLPPPPPPRARPNTFEAEASPQDLGDLFAYTVNGPTTIRRNESALVPILSAPVDAERVSLWNDRIGGPRPLRSLWITNTSGLTLDAGSFTVLDDTTFAGEGLLEAVKPGDKRLASYAVDLGVQVEAKNGDEVQQVTRVSIARGVGIQTRELRARKVYTIRNNDAAPRTIVIEHPIRAGWALVSRATPVETSLSAYRFSTSVGAHSTATLTVDERRPTESRYTIADLDDRQLTLFLRESHESPELERALAPIRTTKATLASLAADVAAHERAIKDLSADQTRMRENMRAMKDSGDEKRLLKRYVAELDAQENRLAVLRRELGELTMRVERTHAELSAQIEALTLDIDL